MYCLFKCLQARYFLERGQGMIEYALVLVFIVGVIALVTSTNLVQSINDIFVQISNEVAR